MENLPNRCQGLSILIRMEEELDSWVLGCVEQENNVLTYSSSISEEGLLTLCLY